MVTIATGARATALTASLQLDVGRPADALQTVAKAIEWLKQVAPRLLFAADGVPVPVVSEVRSGSAAQRASPPPPRSSVFAAGARERWTEAALRSTIAAEHVLSL